MQDVIYHIIVLAVAALAAVHGFRRGLARQTPAVIGLAFGIVCARLLAPALIGTLQGALPMVHGHVEEQFAYDTLSTGIVFGLIYVLFATITSFLGKVLTRDDRTILDNMAGAVFALFKYMLVLSIIYNLGVAVNPRSALLRSVRSDDGNVVEEVMLLSPALLGGQDVEELSHRIQLEEAKKIS